MTNSADPDQFDLDLQCLLRQGMSCLTRGLNNEILFNEKKTYFCFVKQMDLFHIDIQLNFNDLNILWTMDICS